MTKTCYHDYSQEMDRRRTCTKCGRTEELRTDVDTHTFEKYSYWHGINNIHEYYYPEYPKVIKRWEGPGLYGYNRFHSYD